MIISLWTGFTTHQSNLSRSFFFSDVEMLLALNYSYLTHHQLVKSYYKWLLHKGNISSQENFLSPCQRSAFKSFIFLLFWGGSCNSLYLHYCACSVVQSCAIICDPMDSGLPGSMEFFRQEYWSGLPFPPPGDLTDPGVEPTSLESPAQAGRFFTTSATWETHLHY